MGNIKRHPDYPTVRSLRETNARPLIDSIIFLAKDAEGAAGNPTTVFR